MLHPPEKGGGDLHCKNSNIYSRVKLKIALKRQCSGSMLENKCRNQIIEVLKRTRLKTTS